jgi:hypothetical protein
MATFIHTLVEKVISILEQDVGKALAKKVERKYKQKILEGLLKLFGEKKKLIKKLLLIGGGEIGTEIGLAARNRGWHVRGICFERDYKGELSKTPVPIKNLPFYTRERTNDETNFYYTGEKASPAEPFQWTVCEEFDIDAIKEIILLEKPHFVLLEDTFLTPTQWEKLHKKVLGELEASQQILFVPSLEEIEGQKSSYADIFLSKIKMKEFLTEIGLEDHVLGKPCGYLNVQNLLKPRRSKEYLAEFKKIEKTLKEYEGPAILKFDTMSSGHGQFVISDLSFLNHRLIEDSVKAAERRVKNAYCVLEKYLGKKEEVCAIVARVKGRRVGLNRIYYKKYEMGKTRIRRLRWVTRLVTSESRAEKDNTLWIALNKIVDTISKKLKVPFVYIEFIIDKRTETAPKIYVNEISFRPDDAGFVSFLSHPNDEFNLFIDSLESLLEKEEIEDSGKSPEYLEPRGQFACMAINPGKKVRFPAENLTWPLVGDPRQTNFKLSLYEKFLLEKNGKIDYGRIVGYVWYPVRQDPKQLLNEYKSSLDLSENTYQTILETLKEIEEA